MSSIRVNSRALLCSVNKGLEKPKEKETTGYYRRISRTLPTSYKRAWRASKRTNARCQEEGGEERWVFDVLANLALRVTPVLVAYWNSGVCFLVVSIT